MPGPIMPIGQAASASSVVVPVATANGADFTDTTLNWRSNSAHNAGAKFSLSMVPGSTTVGVIAYRRATDGYGCAKVVTFDSSGVPSFGAELLLDATLAGVPILVAVLSSTLVAFSWGEGSTTWFFNKATISGTSLTSLGTEKSSASWGNGWDTMPSLKRWNSTKAIFVGYRSTTTAGGMIYDASGETLGSVATTGAGFWGGVGSWYAAAVDGTNSRGVMWGRSSANTNFNAVQGFTLSGTTFTWVGSINTISGTQASQTLGGNHNNEQALYLGNDHYICDFNYHMMECDFDGTTMADWAESLTSQYGLGGGLVALDISDSTKLKLARFKQYGFGGSGMMAQGVHLQQVGNAEKAFSSAVDFGGTSGLSGQICAQAVDGASGTNQRVCLIWADANDETSSGADIHYRTVDFTTE
jgi:hypothetical protein